MAALISYNNSLRLVVNSPMSRIRKWIQTYEFFSCDWLTQEYEEQVIQSRKPGNLQRVGKYKILYDKLARIIVRK